LTGELAGAQQVRSAGAQGHSIRANAQLLALRLMRDAGHEGYQEMSENMVRQLMDYSHFALASSQRIFLMKQVQDMVHESPSFPTLGAELVGLAYSANNPIIGAPDNLRPTQVDSVWQWVLPGRDRVALFTSRRIRSEVEKLIQQQALPPGATVTLLAPETDPFQVGAFASVALGDPFVDWWLELHLADESLFESTADRQVVIYLWTGALVIAALIAFAAIIAHYMRRQLQLNRLKSDLVSTVSHELKTPLASMRVLVDTLLDGHYQNGQMTQEYLQLIARENVRLSQLIDNFLTFSRLERGTQSFAFSQVDLTEVATTAFEVLRDKLEAAGFVVETAVASSPVLINGDRDALITVVLNLLDNAYKYSDEVKHIVLRVYQEDNAAYLEVEDRGIGMAQRETANIFERFYQMDQQLARQVEGCGLGLNIVKSIVEAHGGSIVVDSRPGAGSKFVVKCPLAATPSSKKLQRIAG
jgi:signal transduction histidine kinase